MQINQLLAHSFCSRPVSVCICGAFPLRLRFYLAEQRQRFGFADWNQWSAQKDSSDWATTAMLSIIIYLFDEVDIVVERFLYN